MQKCTWFTLAGIGTLLIGPALATAQTILTAHLTSSAEVTVSPINPTLTGGGPRPFATGDATFTVAADQQSMTMDVTVFDLDFGTLAISSGGTLSAITGFQTADVNDNILNAHIHASATVVPTSNTGVVWGFFGSPFNDNNPFDASLTPFTGVGQVGGTIHAKWDANEGSGTTFAAQLNNLLTGHAYINFHTQQFGGGEIRGNFVPEPTSISLLLAGTFITFTGARRIHRSK